MAFSVRPTTYREKTGFHVGGRPKGEKGHFPISIFVRCRSTAVRIKKVLNTPLPKPQDVGWPQFDAAWKKRSNKIDMLIHADSRVKVCKR